MMPGLPVLGLRLDPGGQPELAAFGDRLGRDAEALVLLGLRGTRRVGAARAATGAEET